MKLRIGIHMQKKKNQVLDLINILFLRILHKWYFLSEHDNATHTFYYDLANVFVSDVQSYIGEE